jgi:hypothetical protein
MKDNKKLIQESEEGNILVVSSVRNEIKQEQLSKDSWNREKRDAPHQGMKPRKLVSSLDSLKHRLRLGRLPALFWSASFGPREDDATLSAKLLDEGERMGGRSPTRARQLGCAEFATVHSAERGFRVEGGGPEASAWIHQRRADRNQGGGEEYFDASEEINLIALDTELIDSSSCYGDFPHCNTPSYRWMDALETAAGVWTTTFGCVVPQNCYTRFL